MPTKDAPAVYEFEQLPPSERRFILQGRFRQLESQLFNYQVEQKLNPEATQFSELTETTLGQIKAIKELIAALPAEDALPTS